MKRRRPVLFNWGHLSLRSSSVPVTCLTGGQELWAERGFDADHSAIWRWVQRYTPERELRRRSHLKPRNRSWRVDETYLRDQGRVVLVACR